MQLFDVIDEDNFVLYASHVYDNPQAHTVEEFYSDLNRIKYLKRLLKRYYKQGDLQERLILNHLVVIFNVFGIEGALKLIFFKVEKNHWPALRTCLLYLNFMHDKQLPEVPLDQLLVDKLRAL